MRALMILGAALFFANVAACGKDGSIVVGRISEKSPPSSKELVEPKTDDGVARVELRSAVAGEIGEHSKLDVYVLVNPLSNPDTQNAWRVQDPAILSVDHCARCM